MTATKRSKQTRQASDGDLMETYVELPPHHLDPGDARIAAHGYPIWILVDALVAAEQDVTRVAREYELPEEAVRAAVAFYQRHREAIDARIRANGAVFGAYA